MRGASPRTFASGTKTLAPPLVLVFVNFDSIFPPDTAVKVRSDGDMRRDRVCGPVT